MPSPTPALSTGDPPTVGIVVLAAGGSSRLGTPKQLLPYRGRTLLRHAVETAVAAAVGPVVVVLGAWAKEVCAQLAGLDVGVVVNQRWAEGLSTSLQAGLDGLVAGGGPAAALFLTCDQPLVTPDLLRAIAAAYCASRPPLVACEYAGTAGVPALFDRSLFVSLRALTGDEGARSVIRLYRAAAVVVPFPDAALDVDTAADARRLANGDHRS